MNLQSHILVVTVLMIGCTGANADILAWAGNSHSYEIVFSGQLTWQDAKNDAAARSFQGVTGYLATVTTVDEQNFLLDGFGGGAAINYLWVGGYQDITDPSYSENYGGWKWITGEPWNTGSNKPYFSFNNIYWDGSSEEYLITWWQNGGLNDYKFNGVDARGYIVEYNVFSNGWMGGTISNSTKWDVAANWNPSTAVPSGSGTYVSFGNQPAANNVVDMISQGQTVGSITFAATTSTTIQSTGGFSLTLDNNDTTSTIDVVGNHTISTPVLLNNDATIYGTGTLNSTSGISGNHALTVLGNLTATSIRVETLTIGTTGAMAVPEPSTFVLLGIGVYGLLAWAWRRQKAW